MRPKAVSYASPPACSCWGWCSPDRRAAAGARGAPGAAAAAARAAARGDAGAQPRRRGARSSSPSPPSAARPARRRGGAVRPGAGGDGAARPRRLGLLRDPGAGRALRGSRSPATCSRTSRPTARPATRCCCWATCARKGTGWSSRGGCSTSAAARRSSPSATAAPSSVSRRMGHTFADEVIRFLIGKPGIALSSIAFASRPQRRQRDLGDGLRRGEPAADHRPPLDLDVAGLEPGRRVDRLHLVLQRPAGHLPRRPRERPQAAGRHLRLAQHQPELLAGRQTHRLRPLARRQHRDLHRRPRRRQTCAG